MIGNNLFDHSAFLEGLSEELEPTPDQKQLARERYEDLGRWLREHAAQTAGRDVEVYPQGSGNLGTTNRNPFTGEFDIDLVIRVKYLKSELTQKELNQKANGWLGSYISVRQNSGHPLAPTELDKGKRAWTLHYGNDFHMDALPVVPDLAGELNGSIGDPSWLTDKSLVRWQPTNPRGFAKWFRSISEDEQYERKLELAKQAAVEVEELPDDQVKTSLHLTVQLLKRHRDYMFHDDQDGLAPPSAVITALAAHSYQAQVPSGGHLADVVRAVVANMPAYLHWTSSGNLWVPNPACSEENYADRYEGNPDKEQSLKLWLKQAQDDFDRITTIHDASRLSNAIDHSFGRGLGARVADKVGRRTQKLRTQGALGSTAAGTLTTGIDSYHRPHRFYGSSAS